MQHKELSVVLPLKENSESFPLALLDIDNYLSKSSTKYEIIVSGAKDSEKLAVLKKKIGLAIEHIRFVSSEAEDVTSISKAGMLSAVGDNILWVNPDYIFELAVAETAISNISAEGANIVDLFFVAEGNVPHLFSPLGMEGAALIAMERESAQKISAALSSRFDFAVNLALASGKMGLKMEVLKHKAVSVLHIDKKSIVATIVSALFTRARFEINWIREGLSILQKV